MKKLLYIFLLSSVFACEQIVEIDVPSHDPELVLSSFYKSGQTEIIAYLTNSVGILVSQNEIQAVENASVQLYEDGQLLTTLSYDVTKQRYSANLSAELEVDKLYELKATAPGYSDISSSQRMPKEVPILNVGYESEGGIDIDGFVLDELEIEFQEPVDVENYYEIKVFIYDRNSPANLYHHYLTTLDPILEEGFFDYVFKDESINGQKYKLKVLGDPIPIDDYGFRIELQSVTRDYYLYSKSIIAQEYARDNPFAEPVIVHSNVVNGQGVFGIRTSSFFTL